MIEQKCDLSSCDKMLSIAESEEEFNQINLDTLKYPIPADAIGFSYKTFFFCSSEHAEEYAN